MVGQPTIGQKARRNSPSPSLSLSSLSVNRPSAKIWAGDREHGAAAACRTLVECGNDSRAMGTCFAAALLRPCFLFGGICANQARRRPWLAAKNSSLPTPMGGSPGVCKGPSRWNTCFCPLRDHLEIGLLKEERKESRCLLGRPPTWDSRSALGLRHGSLPFALCARTCRKIEFCFVNEALPKPLGGSYPSFSRPFCFCLEA